jgi:hypothetical protein
MTYTHQTPFTYVYDKFVHFAEDFDCILCANYKSRAKERDERFTTGCGQPVCEFQNLKDEAIKHNRLKRPKGWWKSCQTE